MPPPTFRVRGHNVVAKLSLLASRRSQVQSLGASSGKAEKNHCLDL